MKNYLFVLILFSIVSCDSEDSWDCIQKEGEKIRREFFIDTLVTELKVFDDIKLVLYSSDTQKFELIGGENLLNEVEFVSDTGTLHVFNRNSCRWSKPPFNIELHVYSSKLRFIEKASYADIVSGDTLYHNLRFKTLNPGTINLTLNNGSISFELYSLTNVTLKGKTNSFGFYYGLNRDARVDASNLIANRASLTHNGYNDIIVNPVQTLSYRIWNSGNIIVVNEPENLNEVEVTGNGKLILDY